jgi:2-methylcitrate dehydratase PrpD
LVNGTAAHGEDFDDTFEGGPVHAGAVIVPAVLAACERHNPDGRMALIGIAAGTEVLCRLSLVVPKAVHKAGFHPTAIFGAMGAAAGVGAALNLNAKQIVDALGIAGSMAGGIIEYLAEGAWTKRLHAGWAAQSGIRAALLARGGFVGPRTVFEGVHGLFHGFAHTSDGDYNALLGDFGTRWVTDTVAFKPYPCGTMAQPYIDCARRLAARDIKPEDVSSARWRKAPCIGYGSLLPTSSARATAMPRNSRRLICSRPGLYTAGWGWVHLRKTRSAMSASLRWPPRSNL